MDHFADNFEAEKEKSFTSIYNSLMYLRNSHIYSNSSNPNDKPIDIERDQNTVLLDILNYHAVLLKGVNHNINDISTDKVSKNT